MVRDVSVLRFKKITVSFSLKIKCKAVSLRSTSRIVLPWCFPWPSSVWYIRMPALEIFFFFLFIPQHFSWQEVDSEEVKTKPRASTLEITKRLNERSVCLSRVHPQVPTSSPAKYCGQRAMAHCLDLFVRAIFLRNTSFKGRKLVFLYLLWMGYFLPIYNSLEMLLRNPDDEVRNKSFFWPWSSLTEEEWTRASARPAEQQHHLTCLEESCRSTVIPTPPWGRSGEEGLSLSVGSKGRREICLVLNTKANALRTAYGMVAIDIYLFIRAKYAPSLRKIEWAAGEPPGLVLWKILNAFASSSGVCHAGYFPHPLLPFHLPF